MPNNIFRGSGRRPRFNKRVLRYEWRNNGPVVTRALVAINVVVWLVEILLRFLAPTAMNAMVSRGALAPLLLFRQPWTVVTSMFLHDPTQIFHILFNMISLWFVGSVLEKMLGHWSYFALYLTSGIGGSLGVTLWARFAPSSMQALGISAYGASGAIFGLFAALLIVYRRAGVNTTGFIVLLAINFATPLLMPNEIAWQAHVGGFVLGGIFTMLMMWRAPGLRRLGIRARTGLIGGGLIVVSLALTFWAGWGVVALAMGYIAG